MTIDPERTVTEILARTPVTAQGDGCTQAHVDTFGGVVPDFLIDLWRRAGFSGLLDGAVWLVDPLADATRAARLLDGIAVPFLAPGAVLVPVARSAFGEHWFLSPGHGVCLSVSPADGTRWHGRRWSPESDPDAAAARWFRTLNLNRIDLFDAAGRGVFAQAATRLGTPGDGECYAFVPSLRLGGTVDAARLDRVRLREHLAILDMIRHGELGPDPARQADPADRAPLSLRYEVKGAEYLFRDDLYEAELALQTRAVSARTVDESLAAITAFRDRRALLDQARAQMVPDLAASTLVALLDAGIDLRQAIDLASAAAHKDVYVDNQFSESELLVGLDELGWR